jgi:nicotinamide-nucleotide amidase
MKSTQLPILIGKKLSKQKKTLGIAESCTGGYISHQITSVPGSSAYFTGSVVAYDNKIKTKMLGVKTPTLKKFGAVSSECASQMVSGILSEFGVSYAVATTGIAGPGGAVAGKPVGTVFIAVATPDMIQVGHFRFKGNRKAIIEQSTHKALEMLWSIL